MAKMSINVPHHLEREVALARIKELLPQVKEKQKDRIQDLTEKWNGNVCTFGFTVKSLKISGRLEVNHSAVQLDGEIPWTIALLKGIIERTIRTEAEKLLA